MYIITQIIPKLWSIISKAEAKMLRSLSCLTLHMSYTLDFNFYIASSLYRVKVGVSCPVQQPGSYWERPSALLLVGLCPSFSGPPRTFLNKNKTVQLNGRL